MRRGSRGELALALFFAAIGVLWVVRAARMPLWQGFAPDSGFLPLIYGCLLGGLAVAVLVFDQSAAKSEELRKPLLVLAALTAAVAALPLAGFLLSVFLLLFFLYAVIERLPLRPAGIASAAITGALYVVFKVWLGVPLPVLFS